MARLPKPGGDSGNWGEILNDYLGQAHNGDGSLKDLPQSKITGLTDALATKASTSDLAKYDLRDSGGLALSDFLADGQAMPSDGLTDATSLMQAAINQAASLYATDGLTRTVHVPTGKFLINTPLTPPDGGGFGIVGAGMNQTVFIAPVDQPFLYNATNPDPWTGSPAYSNMVFGDFTIDATRHTSDTYNSNRKGIFIQRVSNTDFYRVKIKDTNATGFGLDYCNNVSFVNCVADGCGKGKLSYDPSTRFDSGAGIGIGAGAGPAESVTILNCLTANCGTSGIFIEHLSRSDGLYDTVGFKIIGNVSINNNIGISDQGSTGTLIQGNVFRGNGYAGFRLGVSSPGQQGGYDGQFVGNTVSANGSGIMIVGTALGGYNISDNSIVDNSSYGIYFPQTTLAGSIGPGLKITNNRLLRNGGSGIFGETDRPLPDMEISGNYIKDNGVDATKTYRDGMTFLSSLARPRIYRNRIAGNYGAALALRGSATSLSPRIVDNDYDGSFGGTYIQTHTIADTTRIGNNLGNSTSTVTNAITIPTPKTVITGWSGASTTRTRIEGGFLGNGSVQGVVTGTPPRILSPTITVSAGQIWTGSIYVKTVVGRRIRSVIQTNTVSIDGPAYRATGNWQRIALTAVIPSGETALRIGVKGLDLVVGDVIEADAAMLTPGADLWPYIDGAQTNCAWSGTAYASTSIMTLPS